jgi:hypothetical protein
VIAAHRGSRASSSRNSCSGQHCRNRVVAVMYEDEVVVVVVVELVMFSVTVVSDIRTSVKPDRDLIVTAN